MTPEEIDKIEKENESLREEIEELTAEKESISIPVTFPANVTNNADGTITVN